MNNIEQAIFDVADALRVPVLILALVALGVTLLELGAFGVELLRRRRRDFARLETAAVDARAALERGDEMGAKSALRPVAWSTQMARALAFMVDQWGKGQLNDRLAKGLADFDFRSLRRLERTRLLVRAGPALGLMGTLIPLSPALSGLAKGDVKQLQDNLQVAFSVTVLGLLVGAVAFGISLVRDRMYGQDLSDLEFVMVTLSPDAEAGGLVRGGSAPAGAVAARPVAAGAAAQPPRESTAATAKPPPPMAAMPLGATQPPPQAGASGTAVGGAAAGPAAPGAAAIHPARDAARREAEAAAASGQPTHEAEPAPAEASAAAPDPARDATRQQAMPPAPEPEPPTQRLPPPPTPEAPADGNSQSAPEGTPAGEEGR